MQTEKVAEEFNLIIAYIRENDGDAGWFFRKHFKESIPEVNALLYFRSLFAAKCVQDVTLEPLLRRAIMSNGNAKDVCTTEDLNAQFPPYKKDNKIIQMAKPIVGETMAAAMRDPATLYSLLADTKSSMPEGWIVKEWFYTNKESKKKLTQLELEVFRLQVFLLAGQEAFAVEEPEEGAQNLSLLKHAWGPKFHDDRKSSRDLEAFIRQKVKDPIIPVKLKPKPRPKKQTKKAQQRRDSSESDAFEQLVGPSRRTPIKTRRFGWLPSPSANTPSAGAPIHDATFQSPQVSPLSPSPVRKTRLRSTLSSTKKIALGMFKRPNLAATPDVTEEIRNEERSDNDVHDTPLRPSRSVLVLPPQSTDQSESSTSVMQWGMDSDRSILQGGVDDDSDNDELMWGGTATQRLFVEVDNNNQEPPLPRAPRAAKAKVFTYNQSDFDDEIEENINELEGENLVESVQRRAEGACAVTDAVCHLAAVGSRTVKSTMNAILVESLGDKATEELLQNGYSKKRKEIVVKKKQAVNERRKRQAEKRGVEPILVDEEPQLKFKAPLKNKNQKAKCRNEWKNYLVKGKDAPVPKRACHIKEEKIDALIGFIVDNFQFRPGKTRNFRFKQDGTRLTDLPVYMRYGSYGASFASYTAAVADEMRVGEKAFRDILKATTIRGSYNQGLSYFYVEFIDMTKLVVEMLQRLKTIAIDDSIAKEKKKEINEWIEKAKVNTECSREYLTHQYYADIRKTGTDGWICAAYALGDCQENGELEFNTKSRLCLAFTNHLFLIHSINLVSKSIPEQVQMELEDELSSMIKLAKLSYLETRHYAHHIMRGWWQDTAINELKRLLFTMGPIKGIVCDHKNKLVPRMKFEPMTAYFSKSGISILGSMVFWVGVKAIGKYRKETKGVYVWFFDIIMNNTTSQDARDLMPGIEAIRSELQQEYFREIAGPTEGFYLLSDNALISASHSAFVTALNNQAVDIDVDVHGDGSTITTVGQDSYAGDGSAIGGSAITATDHQDSDVFRATMRQSLQSPLLTQPKRAAILLKWLTWEAQRGKTQLDTHFAYLNKQLANACLVGDINYGDPSQVFDALSYKGGSKATTTLLLDELPTAQDLFDACDKALSTKERTGINSVHDITFGQGKVTWQDFSNLETRKKTILATAAWPKYEAIDPVGDVLKRHVNQGEPVFYPFEKPIHSDDKDEEMMDPKLLSTRIYNSLLKHSSGMDLAHNKSNEQQSARRQLDQNMAAERASDVQLLRQLDSVQPYLDMDSSEYFSLSRYWAKKKNRTHLSLSKEVQENLVEMFKSGQGSTNKAVRYTAERAVMELHSGLLKFRWDQRLVTSVSKVKSFFGRKYQAEQKENDGNLITEVKGSRLERGKSLLLDNEECEEELRRLSPSVEEATLENFSKIKAPLLKAFLRCRLSEDACSAHETKLPKKGSLAEARAGEKFLIRWAFDLRASKVKAKIFDKDLAGEELDAELFQLANESPEQPVDILETALHEAMVEKDSDVQEDFAEDKMMVEDDSSSDSSDDDDE